MDYCIQNFHLGRKILGYTVVNLVLRWGPSRAIKRDFRLYIWWYTSPNENFEYAYPHSNAFLKSSLKLECCKPHISARHPTKCDLTNDVKLFPTVYHRIYCHKFWYYPIKHCITKASALECAFTFFFLLVFMQNNSRTGLIHPYTSRELFKGG